MEVRVADFKLAFENVIKLEELTVDAGGRTRFGIAARFHPELPEEFFTGPAEDALAEAEKIEEHDYWDRMRLGEVKNQNVANKLFDMAVNMGVRQAALYAQRAANALRPPETRLVEDGVAGGKTLAAINAVDAIAFHQLLCELSEAHYRHLAAVNPEQAVNLRGWLKRASA
jgi:lysozyme family protein